MELDEALGLYTRVTSFHARTLGPTHPASVAVKHSQTMCMQQQALASGAVAKLALLFPDLPDHTKMLPENKRFSSILAKLYMQTPGPAPLRKIERVLRPAFNFARQANGLTDAATWKLGEELSMVTGGLGMLWQQNGQ